MVSVVLDHGAGQQALPRLPDAGDAHFGRVHIQVPLDAPLGFPCAQAPIGAGIAKLDFVVVDEKLEELGARVPASGPVMKMSGVSGSVGLAPGGHSWIR